MVGSFSTNPSAYMRESHHLSQICGLTWHSFYFPVGFRHFGVGVGGNQPKKVEDGQSPKPDSGLNEAASKVFNGQREVAVPS